MTTLKQGLLEEGGGGGDCSGCPKDFTEIVDAKFNPKLNTTSEI